MSLAVTNADAVKGGTVNGFTRGALHLIAITVGRGTLQLIAINADTIPQNR